ncbi:flagellar hook-basal body protein [Sulfurospirillum arcachonense]|uniref:flagellar hook-basal body protein n=1 Tax=Sulfurospirillum arcachonense TaxID=57666 RepID=UPI00046889EC|nr:flagellar hook-basal body protein [Sulfurospirillum arcachonense]
MQNGYYSTTGAMVTQFNRLDVISNNLANVNTTAFKRDDVVIGDFKRIYQEFQEELPIKDHTKEAAKYLNASIDRVPQVSEQYVEYNQGGLKSTGNPLDLALKREDVFFMVDTPNGLALTQNGSFVLNNEGVLTTKEGYPVIPATYFQNQQYITVNQNNSFTVDKTGNIYSSNVEEGLAAGENPVGRLFIAQSDDIKSLTKEGTNLFKFKNVEDLRDLQDADVVAQGFLETSNVNPVKEMVGLIEAHRMVEMYQKVMTSHMNDLNNDAINKLAMTRA